MSKTKKINQTAIYNVKELGQFKTIVLGLQHTFAMFGATVLVPILTGLEISTTLLMAGLGTLLFHFITKGKVPAFLGSSFAFLGGYAAVAPLSADGVANKTQLAYACGGVFCAGLVYLILAGLIKLFGVRKVMRFFPPIVTGPIIIAIGLILAPSAISNASTNWLLAIVSLIIIIICNIYGKGMIKIVPIMLGVAGSYVVALVLYYIAKANPSLITDYPSIFALTSTNATSEIVHSPLFDFSGLKTSGIIALPPLTIAKFNISAIITIMPIALATMMEHIGDISAIGATTGKNYISDPGLHKTLMGDGLATSFSALFGGPANTTYGENTGVLALTKVYDPIVMRIAALFAIVLSFFPIFSEIIRSIPAAIIGGISFILYGMISAIGVRNVVENKVDLTKNRNLIIAAVILVSAIGFNGIGGITFTVMSYDITLSGLAIAAICGIILNAILPGNEYAFPESD